MTAPEHATVSAAPVALAQRSAGAARRRVTGVRVAVLAAYVGAIVTANWALTHWSALLVGAVAIPAGTLWAGVLFTLRDLLHECLGGPGVLAAIAAGAGTVLAAGLHRRSRSPACSRSPLRSLSARSCMADCVPGRWWAR